MTVYLDCNATTPIEERVAAEVVHHMVEEYGNAGSRTHDYGNRAKQAVQRARAQVAAVVDAEPDEVVFTSGATEANNLAILGLREAAESLGRRHVVSTQIEHKAVLEPLELLGRHGFEVELLSVEPGGFVRPDAVADAVRPDTVLVSVMHVNNETGVRQPIDEIAEVLLGHDAYFHVDAAQGFGKDLTPLRHRRIDLMSVSAHKAYGPKGVGALIARRRGYDRPPLAPLMVGGGQERGLRPGTLPVPLIVGLGAAAEIATADCEKRAEANTHFREQLLAAMAPLSPRIHGDPERTVPHVVNLSIPGVDGEAAIVALKDVVAVSNGSACTSHSYEPSHVLQAMGLSDDEVRGALRISWCHFTEEPDWPLVVDRLAALAS